MTRRFTFSATEPSGCTCVSILYHCGAVYSFFVVFLQQASTYLRWFWTKTNMLSQSVYSQLVGGRGLRHGVVDESVAERHKLVADDFNGLLSSRTWGVQTLRNDVLRMRNSSFYNHVKVVTSQERGDRVRLSCTVPTAAGEFRQKWGGQKCVFGACFLWMVTTYNSWM